MNLEAVNAACTGGLDGVPPAGEQQSSGDFIAILLQMLGTLMDNPTPSLPVAAEMPDAGGSGETPDGERFTGEYPACFSGGQWELEALLSGITLLAPDNHEQIPAPPAAVLPEGAEGWKKILAALLPVTDAGRCDAAGDGRQTEAGLFNGPAVIARPEMAAGTTADRVQVLWRQAAGAGPLPDEAGGGAESPVLSGRPGLAVVAETAGAAGDETAGNAGPVSAAMQHAPAFSAAAESRMETPGVPVDQSRLMQPAFQLAGETLPGPLPLAVGERNPPEQAAHRWHGEPELLGVELPVSDTTATPDTAGSVSRVSTAWQPLQESVMDQLKARLLLIKEAGSGPAAVRFRLHPPALGEVTVRVQLAGQGRVVVDIVTESALVREMFEAGLGELKQRFEQLQIPLERVDLYTAGQGGNDGALQNRDYFLPGQARAGPRTGADAGDDLAAAARGDPGCGSIDLWA